MTIGPPSGTVTFLFTDVEGSSVLWQAHPAVMGEAVRLHDQIVRGAVESHGGFVFATGGDGFAVAFTRASDAVAAALDAQAALLRQAWPDGIELMVRMGLHTGEAEERDGNFFGDVVNRAARVMDAARGCQVLASSATVGLVRGRLPQGVTLFEHGRYSLRSFAQPEVLVEVLASGSSPRPLVRVRPWHSSDPEVRTLVGRDGELTELDLLLADARLLTLTGPGGVGKTALALQAAARAARGFADGIHVVELASVRDAASVPLVVGEVLSVRPQTGVSPAELVIRALAYQDALVVFDNCEHVLDVVSALVNDIVRDCPGVTVLATSREALGVPAEHTFEVRPLSTDAAVRLFHDLIAQHHGGYTATASDVATIAELCDRLDCLPLAIELASARARSMPLDELVARLDERFRLLRGGRTAAGRHQTLRHTVAWSYDLLADDERRVFERLSVFAGSFTLRAAEAVCRHDTVEDIEVDAVIAGLADKSMVTIDMSGCYSMLETLRQFGADCLNDRDELVATRDLHLAHYVKFVRSAHDGLLTADERLWWQRLQAEWANIRAAFAWACHGGDVDSAATIAVNLTWAAHWHDTAEPYSWAQQVLDLPDAEASEFAVDILAANAMAAWERGELTTAVDLGRRALALEKPGQRNIDCYAEGSIMAAADFLGSADEAAAFIDRGERRARDDNQPTIESYFISARAIVLNAQQRYDEGGVMAANARRVAESSGNPSVLAWAMSHQAVSLSRGGRADPAGPIALFEDALRLARVNDLTLAGFLAQYQLVPLLVQTGRTTDAVDHVIAGLSAMRRRSSWMFALQILLEACELLRLAGDDHTAATAYGAIRTSSIAGVAHFASRLDHLRASLTQQLGHEKLEALASEGEGTPIERILSLAQTALQTQAAGNHSTTAGPEIIPTART